MTKNIELLEKTLKAIRNSPDYHDQDHWIDFNVCGTTMCTAGFAAVEAGAQVPTQEQHGQAGWALTPEGKLGTSQQYWDGEADRVSMFSAKKLGFNEEEKDYIFFCMDNAVVLARIEQLIELWKSGEEFSYSTHDTIG